MLPLLVLDSWSRWLIVPCVNVTKFLQHEVSSPPYGVCWLMGVQILSSWVPSTFSPILTWLPFSYLDKRLFALLVCVGCIYVIILVLSDSLEVYKHKKAERIRQGCGYRFISVNLNIIVSQFTYSVKARHFLFLLFLHWFTSLKPAQ